MASKLKRLTACEIVEIVCRIRGSICEFVHSRKDG